ncbi:MAG TPA: hypothetical protein DD713_02430 [Nitrospiraceae bacterium]|nr:hypothetical protein [Nitrospiraceae bacterium]
MDKKKKQPKAEADINILAKSIVARATHEELLPEPTKENLPAVREKNTAAVALGRLGGLKGGKARAEKLSPKERKEIARKAAQIRWQK